MKLNEIFNDQNIKLIREAAELFGFSDVKILCNEQNNLLKLVACENKEAKSSYRNAFRIVLIDKLNCDVDIIIENKIKGLYKESLMEECVKLDITAKSEIEKIYGKKLDEISIDPVPTDSISIANNNRFRRHAKFIIGDYQSKPAFFKSNKAEQLHKDFILYLIQHDENSLINAFLSLPPDTLKKVENVLDKVKKDQHKGDEPHGTFTAVR